MLADGFAIGIDWARAALEATHQKGAVGSVVLPLSRRCRADQQCLGKQLNARFATDTSHFKKTSLTGNVGCQISSHSSWFNAAHHIPESDDEHIGNALKDFMSDCGTPEHLTMTTSLNPAPMRYWRTLTPSTIMTWLDLDT